jgi:hypothetical protein
MYEKKHPAFSVLQKIGKEITQQVKPKAVVVFSGHWEGSSSTIEVNTAENTDLIYEYVLMDTSARERRLLIRHAVSTGSRTITTRPNTPTKAAQNLRPRSSAC